MKLEHSLTPYTKINSKWIKDLNVRTRHYKTLRGNHRKNTLWHKSQQDLFDPPARVGMGIKTKINKWNLMKFKSFCITKETINKTKRQPSEWEKIFTNESMGKGNSQSCTGSTQSARQDKSKEKHAKTNINQTIKN